MVLSLILVGCTAVALRGQPWRPYAAIYFVSSFLSYMSQFVFSGVFKFYTYRSHWIADPFHDERLMALFVLIGIDPLLCVLYARYCRRNPFWLALGFAAIVAGLEVIFAHVGAMEYPVGWGSPISFGFAVAAFLVIWRLHVNGVPRWLHVQAMAFWVAQMPDTLLQGVLWLYHYHLPWALTGNARIDSRIIAVAYSALIQAPVAMWIALRPWRRPAVAIGTAVALFLALEAAARAGGWVIYERWNLAFSGLYYLETFSLPRLYAHLLQRRQKPPLWKPPLVPHRKRQT